MFWLCREKKKIIKILLCDWETRMFAIWFYKRENSLQIHSSQVKIKSADNAARTGRKAGSSTPIQIISIPISQSDVSQCNEINFEKYSLLYSASAREFDRDQFRTQKYYRKCRMRTLKKLRKKDFNDILCYSYRVAWNWRSFRPKVNWKPFTWMWSNAESIAWSSMTQSKPSFNISNHFWTFVRMKRARKGNGNGGQFAFEIILYFVPCRQSLFGAFFQISFGSGRKCGSRQLHGWTCDHYATGGGANCSGR